MTDEDLRTLIDDHWGTRAHDALTQLLAERDEAREERDHLLNATLFAIDYDMDGLIWLKDWLEDDPEAMAELEEWRKRP